MRKQRSREHWPRQSPASEGNVVVRDPWVKMRLGCGGLGPLRSGCGWPLRASRHRCHALVELVRSSATHVAAAAAKQNHFLCHHFRNPLLLAIFIVVASGAQAPLDVHLLALRQVICDILTAPED